MSEKILDIKDERLSFFTPAGEDGACRKKCTSGGWRYAVESVAGILSGGLGT